MNQFKSIFQIKFEKPIRKNSDDFNDSDLDFDSDFSSDDSKNNNCKLEIDNGKPREDIDLIKNFNKEKENISKQLSNKSKKEKNNENDSLDDLYSDKEDSEQENIINSDNTNSNKKEEKDKLHNDNEKSDKINISNGNNHENNDIDNKDKNEINKEEFETTKEREEIENELIISIKNKESSTIDRIKLAEKINFKNEPDKIISTDEYGFIEKKKKGGNKNNKKEEKEQDDDNSSKRRKSSKLLLQVNARMEKWNYMIEHYEEFSTKKKKKALLKSRTRKGVPDSLRGYVWQLFANKKKYYEKGLYEKLQNEPIRGDLELVIVKDLDRTFPLCQFFRDKYGNGQRKLYKVLSTYSKFNKNVGYVQGMGFITAIFLIYMDEESSFYMLHCLMKKYKLEGLYFDGFPDLKKKCYVFLNLQRRYLSNIYNLFSKEGIVPTMYSSSWFISLFAHILDFNIVVRVYDCFLLEGFKVIYRIALALLKLNEQKFFKANSGEVIPLIYKCSEDIDVEELLKVAFGFNISRNYIDKCEEEYEKVKNNKDNEFIAKISW